MRKLLLPDETLWAPDGLMSAPRLCDNRRPPGVWQPKGFRRQGCCVNCTVFSDKFSTDDLAANWTQQSGSWTISGNQLSSSGAGLLTMKAAYPGGGVHTHILRATFKATTGHTASVIFNFVAGSPNTYASLDLTFNGASSTISFTSHGATTTTLATTVPGSVAFTAGNWYQASLCIFADHVQANVATDDVTQPTGFLSYAFGSGWLTSMVGGLATSASGVVAEQFSFEYHHDEKSQCSNCWSACTAGCKNTTTAPAFQVDIAGNIADLSPPQCGYNGAGGWCAAAAAKLRGSFILEYEGAAGNTPWCSWGYTLPENEWVACWFQYYAFGGMAWGYYNFTGYEMEIYPLGENNTDPWQLDVRPNIVGLNGYDLSDGPGPQFSKIYSGAIDCTGLTNEQLPVNTDGAGCDYSGLTCLVTSRT